MPWLLASDHNIVEFSQPTHVKQIYYYMNTEYVPRRYTLSPAQNGVIINCQPRWLKIRAYRWMLGWRRGLWNASWVFQKCSQMSCRAGMEALKECLLVESVLVMCCSGYSKELKLSPWTNQLFYIHSLGTMHFLSTLCWPARCQFWNIPFRLQHMDEARNPVKVQTH